MNSDKKEPVLVTGGSGYIASWIVKYLLEAGYRVNTTVRNQSDYQKISHLRKLSDEYPDKLQFFEADLLAAGSFEKAMAGCRIVIHTASPFKVLGVKDPSRELVKPAVSGTENILNTANQTPEVKKIILTSSVAAIYGDGAEIENTKEGMFTENDWNRTSRIGHLPYSYSKTLAERRAWEIAGKQDRWGLAVINPGFVIGPSLSTRIDGTSVGIILSMSNGKFRSGLPDLYFGVVDVRDVAKAHILAGLNPAASGRFILVAKSLSMLDISAILISIFGNKYRFPKNKIPKFLLYVLGPLLGYSWKYIRLNMGIPIHFDNGRSLDILGMQYRPLTETLRDQVEQMTKDGLLG